MLRNGLAVASLDHEALPCRKLGDGEPLRFEERLMSLRLLRKDGEAVIIQDDKAANTDAVPEIFERRNLVDSRIEIDVKPRDSVRANLAQCVRECSFHHS